MQIEPNENASKRMCTFQFSIRSVIAAASHSATRRNIGLQCVEANGLALSMRFSVDAVTLNRLIAERLTEADRSTPPFRHLDAPGFDSGAFDDVIEMTSISLEL